MKKVYTEAAETVVDRNRKKGKPYINKVSWEHIDQRNDINNIQILSTSSERVKKHVS